MVTWRPELPECGGSSVPTASWINLSSITGQLLQFWFFSRYSNLLGKRNVNVSTVIWRICAILPNISACLGAVLARSSRVFRFWSNPSLEPQTFTWFHKDRPTILCHTCSIMCRPKCDQNSVIMIYLPRKIFKRCNVPRTYGWTESQATPGLTTSDTLFRSKFIRRK